MIRLVAPLLLVASPAAAQIGSEVAELDSRLRDLELILAAPQTNWSLLMQGAFLAIAVLGVAGWIITQLNTLSQAPLKDRIGAAEEVARRAAIEVAELSRRSTAEVAELTKSGALTSSRLVEQITKAAEKGKEIETQIRSFERLEDQRWQQQDLKTEQLWAQVFGSGTSLRTKIDQVPTIAHPKEL